MDVGFLRLPVDLRGLRHEPLLSEPRVVALPTDHRLAGKDTVRLADLAAERLLQNPDAVPEWRTVAAAPTDVPVLRTVEEKLEHVAAGRGIVVLPKSTATFYTRPDVTYSLVEDLPLNQVCLAWDSARRSPLIREFVAAALDLRATVVG